MVESASSTAPYAIIETGGKDSLPMFIKMMHALGKRILVIYDTDSDKTGQDDVATNEKRNTAIHDALKGGGDFFECDPYLEELAGIAGKSKKDKESKMRAHLSTLTAWENVPDGLKSMMAKVSSTCNGTPYPVEPTGT